MESCVDIWYMFNKHFLDELINSAFSHHFSVVFLWSQRENGEFAFKMNTQTNALESQEPFLPSKHPWNPGQASPTEWA